MPIVRLARNHPLPDGNKRAAWVTLRSFVDINSWHWDPKPTVDDAEAAVLAIAAGEWEEASAADWLRGHLQSDPTQIHERDRSDLPGPLNKVADRSWWRVTLGERHPRRVWREFPHRLRMVGYDDGSRSNTETS